MSLNDARVEQDSTELDARVVMTKKVLALTLAHSIVRRLHLCYKSFKIRHKDTPVWRCAFAGLVWLVFAMIVHISHSWRTDTPSQVEWPNAVSGVSLAMSDLLRARFVFFVLASLSSCSPYCLRVRLIVFDLCASVHVFHFHSGSVLLWKISKSINARIETAQMTHQIMMLLNNNFSFNSGPEMRP